MQTSKRTTHAYFAFVITAALLLPTFAAAQHYQQTNLVSDVPGLAATTDPDLVNSWGIARSATSPWWVNDNGTGKSTIYNSSGMKQSFVVTIPPPTGSTETSTPTGIVFSGGVGFAVSNGTASAPALFIFDTEDGTISGWSPTVDATHAILEIDNSGTAVYKGLAIASLDSSTLIYAANFKTGKVDVFDSNWQPTTVPGGFIDASLPEGYAPFGIQNVGGNIFVGFAEQSGGTDEVDGRGLGFVDEFDSGGHLLMKFQHGPWLNAPWGVAVAPANFGHFSKDVLVGNFGSGQIAAFDPTTGAFMGFLLGAKGPIMIPGLWAIAFGAAAPNNGPTNTLFFAAGIDDEAHGLFGTLTPIIHP